MKTKLITSVAAAALLTTAAIANEPVKDAESKAPAAGQVEVEQTTKAEGASDVLEESADAEANVDAEANKDEMNANAEAEATTPATQDTASGENETNMEAAQTDPAMNNQGTGATVEGYVAASQDQILASNFLGSSVYNGTGEEAEAIGDINDVILDEKGAATAVVIGVGGFLGLGEKNVAVQYDRISWTEIDDTKTLIMDATKEELEAAPEFNPNQVEEGAMTDASVTDEQPVDQTAAQ
jgi:sporulation protein YlmC with PRC-barrel domain